MIMRGGLLEVHPDPGQQGPEEGMEAVNETMQKVLSQTSRQIARLYIGSGVANVDDNTREGT